MTDRDDRWVEEEIRYVHLAMFIAISSLCSFGGGTGPSSDDGSYSFDQGDLHKATGVSKT
jgi:hypothetical protein